MNVIRNRNAATVEHTVISYTVEPLRSIFDSETLISTMLRISTVGVSLLIFTGGVKQKTWLYNTDW